LGVVSGDRDILIIAFRNLLDNALKYTEPDGQVEIRATDDGTYAVIEVADTGPGIPEEDLPHIFEELFRGQQAKRVDGSGLGLTLVQKIITLQGGEITVRSREQRGTVMAVRLPLATGQTQPSTSSENSSPR
jgi:two-component system OmpR family sensor kinase